MSDLKELLERAAREVPGFELWHEARVNPHAPDALPWTATAPSGASYAGANPLEALEFMLAKEGWLDPEGCQCEACLRDGPHFSDCAVHNEPAYPAGPCSCGRSKAEG